MTQYDRQPQLDDFNTLDIIAAAKEQGGDGHVNYPGLLRRLGWTSITLIDLAEIDATYTDIYSGLGPDSNLPEPDESPVLTLLRPDQRLTKEEADLLAEEVKDFLESTTLRTVTDVDIVDALANRFGVDITDRAIAEQFRWRVIHARSRLPRGDRGRTPRQVNAILEYFEKHGGIKSIEEVREYFREQSVVISVAEVNTAKYQYRKKHRPKGTG